MQYKILPLGEYEANCTVVWENPSAAWVVDPGADAERLLSFLDGRGLKPALVVLTHAHFDHIGAVPGLQARYPDLPVHVGAGDAPFLGHPANANPPSYPPARRPANLLQDLEDGAEISSGGATAKVIATPGHTPGGVCLYFASAGLLLSGDTLFAGSCGRTDLPGGDAPALAASLRRLAALPPETVVVPGHGIYTTIERELADNPFMR